MRPTLDKVSNYFYNNNNFAFQWIQAFNNASALDCTAT